MSDETSIAAAAGDVPAALVKAPQDAARQAGFRRILSLADFETAARRRLPRMVFGFVAGASETDAAMRDASNAFTDYAFVPRVLRNVAGRTTATQLLGRRYAAPFGIAPMGAAALCAYRADLAFARAAARADIPTVLSAASLVRLEEVRREGPTAWYQAYLAGDPARIEPLIDRVEAAGYDTLVVTADIPVPANRENNVRTGWSIPLKPGPKLVWDALAHPGWLFGTVARTFARHGMPHFENMEATRGPPVLSATLVRNMERRDELAWTHLELIRRRWRGALVVKGLLAPEDARIARETGADGIIVSNHGGRQLDHAIAPLRVLPEIVAQAQDMAVMLDGGIRRGTDVLKALALGAQFVFLGRPFMYAAAVGGEAGLTHAIALLSAEIDRDMALLGIRDLAEIGPAFLRRKGCQ
jgi:L-lactate dehydrogenase (cytochrome)